MADADWGTAGTCRQTLDVRTKEHLSSLKSGGGAQHARRLARTRDEVTGTKNAQAPNSKFDQGTGICLAESTLWLALALDVLSMVDGYWTS